jgi:hypothetical protein
VERGAEADNIAASELSEPQRGGEERATGVHSQRSRSTVVTVARRGRFN